LVYNGIIWGYPHFRKPPAIFEKFQDQKYWQETAQGRLGTVALKDSAAAFERS
jgi:hypothetical protein